MPTYKTMHELNSSLEDRVDYEAQYLGELIIGELWRIMVDQGVSKAELARRMKRSRAYVSRMFSSGTNLTLRSISGALVALNHRLEVEASPHWRVKESIRPELVYSTQVNYKTGTSLPDFLESIEYSFKGGTSETPGQLTAGAA